MKATKDHISLETAKLLINCGVRCEHTFLNVGCSADPEWEFRKERFGFGFDAIYGLPAYTWSEILWEHAEKFFGLSEWSKEYNTPSFFEKSRELLFLLIEKKYDEADEYFRENCVFITNSPDKEA